MFRRAAWLGKLIAAGLIISFLSIWTTGYIVTSYVDAILKQFQLPLEVPPMTMTGVWGKLWGSDPLLVSDVKETSSEGSGEPSKKPEESGQESKEALVPITEAPITDIGIGKGAQAGGETGQAGGVEEGQTEIGAGSDPANGAESATGEEVGTDIEIEQDQTEVAISTDALLQTKDQISEEDKGKLFGLLMTKLPQESWQQISTYVENGLTEQELTTIQQLMAMHLDKAEYEQMMEILKKY